MYHFELHESFGTILENVQKPRVFCSSQVFGELRPLRHLHWELHQICCGVWMWNKTTPFLIPLFPWFVSYQSIPIQRLGSRPFPAGDVVSGCLKWAAGGSCRTSAWTIVILMISVVLIEGLPTVGLNPLIGCRIFFIVTWDWNLLSDSLATKQCNGMSEGYWAWHRSHWNVFTGTKFVGF